MNILAKKRLDIMIAKMDTKYETLDALYAKLHTLEQDLTKMELAYAAAVPPDAEEFYKAYSINYISEYQKVNK